ncbi:MAG: hypothetical protein Q4E50_04740 [Tissierellia bacterium]|nr:hypothetical protein [Tissierellia bacterium]
MNNFINRHKLDENYFKEFASSFMKASMFNLYNRIVGGAVLVLSILLIIVSLRFDLLFENVLLGGIGIVFYLLLVAKYFLGTKRLVKVNQQRKEILFGHKDYVQSEIKDKKCILNSEDMEDRKPIKLSLIRDHYESKNFYFLVFEGRIVVAFAKDGFIKGTFEDFKNYIKTYPRMKSVRSMIFSISLTIIFLSILYYLYQAYGFIKVYSQFSL